MAIALALFAIPSGKLNAQSCEVLGTCEKAKPKPKPAPPSTATRASTPSKPKQPSRCDRLWQSALQQGTIVGYDNFRAVCGKHKMARTVESEIRALYGQLRQECKSEGKLLRERFDDVSSQDIVDYSNKCTFRGTIISEARAVIVDLTPVARINDYAPKWDTSYRDICTKWSWQIKVQTGYPQKLIRLRNSAEKGLDPIAPYLLARHEFDNWFAGGEGLKEAIRLLERASKLGNPRATADLAHISFLLAEGDNRTIDFARLDAALEYASKQGCAIATQFMGNRVLDGYYKSDYPKPAWQGSWDYDSLNQRAIDQGSGWAACISLYDSLYSSRPLTVIEDMADRAKALGGGSCADVYLAVAGMSYLKVGTHRRGPCARDKYDCYRSTLTKAALAGEPNANRLLAQALTEKELGGKRSNIRDAIKHYETAKQAGDVEAMAQLGWIKLFGQYGTLVNRQEGLRNCERAHQLGGRSGTICMAFLEASINKSRELTLSAERYAACTTTNFVQERIDRAVPYEAYDHPNVIVRKIRRYKIDRAALKRDRSRLISMLRTSNQVPSRCTKNAKLLERILNRL